jgi:CRISPR-associated endonuclease/helicase Cas3
MLVDQVKQPRAHTPNSNGDWHDLADHLEAVAQRAEQFGSVFGAGALCRLIGLAHDTAKADPNFQSYLDACNAKRPAKKCPHAWPAAFAFEEQLGILGLAIAGHHAGMPDRTELRQRRNQVDQRSVQSAKEFGKQIGITDSPPPMPGDRKPESWEMLVRMCFSALTDADYLDTEQHFETAKPSARGRHPEISWYAEQLAAHLREKEAGALRSPVNETRFEVLRACKEAASGPPGAYRLTVPTGGGKTLSSLAFSLEHAKARGRRRVIVAIPYTSIIDQTAAVYAAIFGPENVLEHHSGYEEDAEDDAQSQGELRRRLAAENWDCPLVATTTVQLFESLFSNRPSRCRKLHRIANSVIVLDEVQALPPELLLPILDALQELIENYGCTVVFCTATQPNYASFPYPLISEAKEIVPDPEIHFKRLKRVRFTYVASPLTHSQVADRVMAEDQVLCIVNTKKDALEILGFCDDRHVVHLSTLLCPDHRKEVLTEVRRRLKNGESVRLVSTQVVEAGVDLDFPKVMRDVGPLDRIVQAAGRCNREGQLEFGVCEVFSLRDGSSPSGYYKLGTALASTLLAENPERIDQPNVIEGYFRDLFRDLLKDPLRKGKDIQDERRHLAYRKVSEKFKMIADDTITLVAREYDRERVYDILAVSDFNRNAAWYRSLRPLSVSVPVRAFKNMQRDGLISMHDSGLAIYEGRYDRLFGIGRGDVVDPADLFA